VIAPSKTMLSIPKLCIVLVLLLGSQAWSRVLVRWSQAELPATALGVQELVIPWNPNLASTSLLRAASSRGYRVYVEVSLEALPDATTRLLKQPIAGLIVDVGTAQLSRSQVQSRTAHTATKMLFMLTGKQPQMRGQTVTTRDGVLQVSSPTAQPWLDSNLAMVRFYENSRLGEIPVYSFGWELHDSLQQENGPSLNDYALAIAESGAIHADLILNLHSKLETGLLKNEPAAWTTWKQLLAYVRFVSEHAGGGLQAWSNVGIVSDNYDAAYEPMNLMARHNIPFRVVPDDVSGGSLQDIDLVAAFTTPPQQGIAALENFAQNGGTVVVVDAKGKYPWQSVQPVETAEHAKSYVTGKGRVIELAEPVSDPETLAQDVRRLTAKDDTLISLWNALTTIAVPYRNARTGEVVLELVNYADEPIRIQVEVKGSFSAVRYETPDRGCCVELTPVQRDGFTDFVVPSLRVAGRIHLQTRTASRASQSDKSKGAR
jgi:hypothetical protein